MRPCFKKLPPEQHILAKEPPRWQEEGQEGKHCQLQTACSSCRHAGTPQGRQAGMGLGSAGICSLQSPGFHNWRGYFRCFPSLSFKHLLF